MQKKEKIIRIIFSVLFVAAVAALGSAFADTSTDWYQNLVKPAFQPPAAVFSIVWTILYILIAISLSLVSINPKTPKKTLFLYAVGSVLNVLWTYTFFYLENPAGAVFVLILTIMAAVLLFTDVFGIDKTAAYLLLPYIIWLFFALYLSYEIAFLN